MLLVLKVPYTKEARFFLLGRQLCGRNRQPCTGCSVGGAGPDAPTMPCATRTRWPRTSCRGKAQHRAVPMLVRHDRNRLHRIASGTDARMRALGMFLLRHHCRIRGVLLQEMPRSFPPWKPEPARYQMPPTHRCEQCPQSGPCRSSASDGLSL